LDFQVVFGHVSYVGDLLKIKNWIQSIDNNYYTFNPDDYTYREVT
jgi:hypothetical protein